MNYTPVLDFIKNNEGKITGVIAQDSINNKSYTIKGKRVINATGPFSDHFRIKANPFLEERVVLSKGEHLALRMMKKEDNSNSPSNVLIYSQNYKEINLFYFLLINRRKSLSKTQPDCHQKRSYPLWNFNS